MKKIYKMLPLFLATLLLFSGSSLFAEEKEGSSSALRKDGAIVTQNTTNRTLVNIGQVAMWIHADGTSSIKSGGSSGLLFPRGSNPRTGAIFQDQLVWGGLVIDGTEPVIRVGGGQYAVGHVAGKILSQGVAEDRSDTQNVNRLWRIRRDFVTAQLTQDAAEINEIQAADVSQGQVDAVRATYRQDWIDWPASRGAPFYDADGDGFRTLDEAKEAKRGLRQDIRRRGEEFREAHPNATPAEVREHLRDRRQGNSQGNRRPEIGYCWYRN